MERPSVGSNDSFIPYARRPLPETVQIAFIGNSITLHSPMHNIGWLNFNGMAASVEENDYAHIILDNLNIKIGEAHIVNFSCLESGFIFSQTHIRHFEDVVSKKPKIIIIQLGDNLSLDLARPIASLKRIYAFAINYSEVVSRASASGAMVYCVSTWWESKIKDFLIRRICEKSGARFVYIGDIFRQEFNVDQLERFSNVEVDRHPKDFGMRQIASRLQAAIAGQA